MTTRWTRAEWLAYEARRSNIAVNSDGVDDESELHEQIRQFCAAQPQPWICLHGSVRHRTHRTIGEFDFIILMDNGNTLLVECKSRHGKLSTEQAALSAWATKLGHHPHVVRSMAEFYVAIKQSSGSAS